MRTCRPFRRRAARTARPPTERDRVRNPCVRSRFLFLNLASIVPDLLEIYIKETDALFMKVRKLYEKMQESQNKLYFSQ